MKQFDYCKDGDTYYVFHLTKKSRKAAHRLLTHNRGRFPYSADEKLFLEFEKEINKN